MSVFLLTSRGIGGHRRCVTEISYQAMSAPFEQSSDIRAST
jgi:hypothetical protein